jgi:hypothetical protein
MFSRSAAAPDATGLVDRADRAQVAEFEVHYAPRLMEMMRTMNLSHIAACDKRGKKEFPMPAPRVSFEFFPPKSLEASFRLWDTVRMLAPLAPEFRLGHLWRGRHDPATDA